MRVHTAHLLRGRDSVCEGESLRHGDFYLYQFRNSHCSFLFPISCGSTRHTDGWDLIHPFLHSQTKVQPGIYYKASQDFCKHTQPVLSLFRALEGRVEALQPSNHLGAPLTLSLRALWPWIGHLISLRSDFLISKMSLQELLGPL